MTTDYVPAAPPFCVERLRCDSESGHSLPREIVDLGVAEQQLNSAQVSSDTQN